MNRLLSTMIVFGITLPATGQATDTDAELRGLRAEVKMLKSMIEKQRKELDEIRAEAEELRRENADLKAGNTEIRKERDRLLRKLSPEQLAEEEERSKVVLLDNFAEPLKLDQAAPVKSVKVVQVSGPVDVLAQVPVSYVYGVPLKPGPGIARVTSVKDVLVWITGIDTNGMVDGRQAEINMTLYIAGTKRYDTSDGSSRTVFLLKPYDEPTKREGETEPQEPDVKG